jgi:hypothetical protein
MGSASIKLSAWSAIRLYRNRYSRLVTFVLAYSEFSKHSPDKCSMLDQNFSTEKSCRARKLPPSSLRFFLRCVENCGGLCMTYTI